MSIADVEERCVCACVWPESVVLRTRARARALTFWIKPHLIRWWLASLHRPSASSFFVLCTCFSRLHVITQQEDLRWLVARERERERTTMQFSRETWRARAFFFHPATSLVDCARLVEPFAGISRTDSWRLSTTLNAFVMRGSPSHQWYINARSCNGLPFSGAAKKKKKKREEKKVKTGVLGTLSCGV